MTKEEFKRKFVDTGKLPWDKIDEVDFEFMYNDYKFIDSMVAWIFEVPMELVIKKRKAFGISIKRDDYKTLMGYKQQGYMNWDEIDHDRFDYLYNICNLSDSLIAELFDIPKSTVTKKRKEFGISMHIPALSRNDVSSYLDFIRTEPPND